MEQSRFIVKSRDAHGNAVDVLYVARDITEEKSRELMYQKRLKASMKMLIVRIFQKQPFSSV